MQTRILPLRSRIVRLIAILTAALAISSACPPVDYAAAPVPLLEKGHPVDWWFAFKFNSAKFPECGVGISRQCPFGGEPQDYSSFGQQFVYASSESPSLQKGNDCMGDTTADPIGATFDEI